MTSETATTTAEAAEAYRLPTTIRPIHYDTRIWADPSSKTFRGVVRIDLELHEAAQEIVLHTHQLEVTSARLDDGTDLPITLDAEAQLLRLRAPANIPQGAATLEIHYSGPVHTDMAGLYHSQDGPDECLATQCEATDARRILPCFDEPSFKASFAWTVTTDASLVVLANGRLAERADGPEPGKATWRFDATPPMSSYLCAVAIGAFESTDEVLSDGVPLKVWAMGGRHQLGNHARDFAGRLLPWFGSFFGTPYPWGKYDQVAVPSFSFGAMENVGLVVFRASLLLTDPKTTSWQGRKTIDLVVAHEFAHMWFGNLVTMAWWDDLWLNEAFAEWVAHKAVDALEPSHEVWLDFQDRTFGALETDSLEDTHPIYDDVKTPRQARELFDSITYGKGSAVLRMLEAYLGEDAFRTGLTSYFAEFRLKNARGSDLWRHLGEAAGQPVDKIMDSWIRKPGHPVVRIEAGPEGHLRLSQSRARSSPLIDASSAVWPVPLRLRWRDKAGTHETSHLLTGPAGEITLAVKGQMAWVVANSEDVGFYRCDPDDRLVESLAQNFSELSPSEATAFVRDQWGLVRTGSKSIRTFLSLVERLASGKGHHTVVAHWVAIVDGLARILGHLDDPDALASLRRWTARTFQPALADLQWTGTPDEAATERRRRASLVRAVASIGRDAAAIRRAASMAEQERADPESIDPNLAGLVVSVSAQVGDVALFDANLETYVQRRKAAVAPHAVDRYLYSFASFESSQLVDRALDLLSEGTVANQAVGPLLRMMLAEPHAQGPAWSYLKQNWSEILSRVGEAWGSILVDGAGALPPVLNDDVFAFFDASLNGTADQAERRARERLLERREFYERIGPDLRAWAIGLGS